MTTTLVMSGLLAEELDRAARFQMETAGVLTARVLSSGDDCTRLLAREIYWVHEDAYFRREQGGLTVSSSGYVHALCRAEQDGAMAIWLHTHPSPDSSPRASDHDRVVDEQLQDLFRLRADSEYYGALILAPRKEGFSFTGHISSQPAARMPIDRIWVVGDRFRLYSSFDLAPSGLSPAFDRNVRAFGPAIQETLSVLHVCIVGCGGTGSAIAEQLVRLGVRLFTLIDPDDLSLSNITRVYGSSPSQIGQPKVDVLARHLRNIADNVRIETAVAMLTQRSAAELLTNVDLVFGCTDDNAGRLVLSRAATYLMVPVIDCGVLLTSGENGALTGIDGRVTVLSPGQACLVCRGRIDLSRAAAELLTPEERVRREDEGYAPALRGVEPAVVTFTTAMASAAVAELLERLIGYGPEPRPSEVLMRFHDREVSTNSALPRARHYCDPHTRKLGVGRTDPFLEQTWTA
jgi:hypothetical protein